jgi:fibro-slime domain-containing protein
MKKRMLSLILILAMLVSLVPVSTAVEYEPAPNEIKIPVTFYDMSVPSSGTKSNPDFERSSALNAGFQTGLVKNDLKIISVGGTPTYRIPAFNAAKNSITEASFEQWFIPTAASGSNPGNKAITGKELVLTKTSDSPVKYTYYSSSFFPLDGTGSNQQGFGHQGRSHNYHFTMELHTSFTYQTGQEFSFTGDDDVWVFINKKLVIDLGGGHAERSASGKLDTLGLVPGSVYDFDLFFAERHTSHSNFKMETSIELDPVPVKTYDLTATANNDDWGKVIKSGTDLNPSATYEENTDVAVEALPVYGYEFDHWTGDVSQGDMYNPAITVKMTSQKTIQAVFKPRNYTLYLVHENGSIAKDPAVSPAPSGGYTYEYNQTVSLTATADDGYRFDGWDNAPNAPDTTDEAQATVTMTSDRTVKAFFVPVWKLTAETDGNGSVAAKIGDAGLSVPATGLDNGTEVVLTATPNEGYKLKSWYVNERPLVNIANSISVTMDGNMDVRVEFEPMDTYTLTTKVVPEGAGSIIAFPNKLSFREDYEDKTVQLTQQANTGWTFDCWEVVTDAAISVPTSRSTRIVTPFK